MRKLEASDGWKSIASLVACLVSAILFICGLAAIVLSLLPYQVVKNVGDQLAPDKNMRSLTPESVAFWHYPLLIIGVLILGCLAWFIRNPQASRAVLRRALLGVYAGWRLLIADARLLFADIRAAGLPRPDLVALAVIVAVGAGLRLLLIDRAIEFDEAYNFIEFARHSFQNILTDYNVPNNHVFYTLLVRISYLSFGNGPWQLRLPALLASLLLLVAVYFLGRDFYDRRTGLLAAALVAAIPIIVFRSVSARGYILVSLLVVLALLTADYVVRKNNSAGWFLLAFFCALGLYTIPIMVYPFGLIVTWLLVTGLTKRNAPEYGGLKGWLQRLISFVLATAVLSTLFYAPILLTNNLFLVYKRNTVLQPENVASFLGVFPAMLTKMLAEWVAGIDAPLLVLLVIGLLLSVWMNGRLSKNRIALQVVFLAFISVAILLLRPYPITRIWLWVTPLLALWSAAGLMGGLEWLAQKGFARRALGYVPPALALLVLVNGAYAAYDARQTQSIVEDPVVEQVTLSLRPRVKSNDIVLVSDCAAPRYWYYFDFYHIPEATIRAVKTRPFKHAFVITYTGQENRGCKSETMQDVLMKQGPSYQLFNLESARVFARADYVTVYEVEPYPALIKIFYAQP